MVVLFIEMRSDGMEIKGNDNEFSGEGRIGDENIENY